MDTTIRELLLSFIRAVNVTTHVKCFFVSGSGLESPCELVL